MTSHTEHPNYKASAKSETTISRNWKRESRRWLRRLVLGAALLGVANRDVAAGTWTPLAHTAPETINTMLLLSDGSVIGAGGSATAWYRLVPDSTGSYVNGTWTATALMQYARLYFSSDVLRDGRLFVAGSEYYSGTNSAEVYDPIADTWTTTPPPPAGQTFFYDSISKILPNGNVLIAPVAPATYGGTVIYNFTNNSWIVGPQLYRGGYQDEASWVKLPDDSILTIDPFGVNTERYIPSLNQWVNDAVVPVAIYDPYGSELGSAILLPNGKAIFFGATGNTAIYTPSGTTNFGSWAAGPVFPNSTTTPDAPACMMVNGNILCAVSPAPVSTNHFPSPTTFCEYDSVSNSFTSVNGPTGATLAGPTYTKRMLALPSGDVLLAISGDQLYIYHPTTGAPLAAGKPAISNLTQNANTSYHITGTGFNGISEGAAYGDDAQMDSNYPIIRMTNTVSGAVYYARTFNWNSTSVMTGNRLISTEFTLPVGLPLGSYQLVVVANGNSSDPITLPTETLPPAIVIQPRSQTLSVGQNVTFSIGAAGTPLGYYWRRNGSPIAGANSSSYTTNNVQLADSGAVFTCLVSNVNGTTLSSNAVLTMLAPPVNDNCTGAIVVTGLSFTNTQSTIHASSNGDPAPACVSNFGMGVWFAFTAPDNGTVVADTIGSDFDTGLGAYTGSCAALTQVGCDDESGGNQTSKLTHAVTVGVIYYYLAGGYGGASGNLIFHLIYSGIAPTISTQPANQTVSVNGTANFSVAAGGAAPLSYFWRRNGVPIAGASNSFYTTNNVQLTDSGARFSCLVSNAYGTLLSSNALLTVSGPTSSNLVQNWGFETGDFAFWGTTDSLSGFSVVDTAPYPHSGSYGAEAGPIGALGFIGQTLATTPGQTYIFGCYLYGDGNTPNEFVMSWDGLTVLDLVNYTNAGWTNINLLVHATNSMTVMQFGFQNDPSYFGFDDVSVILPVAPTIQSATRTNGNLLIAWSSIPGLVYRVQYKTNLVQTNWIDLGSTITAAGTTSTLSDPIGPDPRRFYHVVLLP